MPQKRNIYDKLVELSQNLWWCWHPEVTQIFREIDPELWTKYGHNPVRLLKDFTPATLEQRALELVLHPRINYAYRRWQEYMASLDTWAGKHVGVLGQRPVAYFSAEFGIHESLAIYSGGLGILAGDHLKSASDLGIPLIAIGLLYHEGYFQQQVDKDGWQQESYNDLDIKSVPVAPALDKEGKQVVISINTRTGTIHAQVWQVKVGRITLYLLDSDVPQNSPEDRRLTARLYGGDQRVRIRQELILGVGGVRALTAMGIQPGVIHMNEGHSAFAGLEVIRTRMKEDEISFDEALRETASAACFTTHTPVPAGHDRFSYDLIEEHLSPLREEMHLSPDGLMALGRVEPQNPNETFCMTVLAFKLSRYANAVSNLHGVVSRRMWSTLWPWRGEEEIPIGHITNGVHVPTWLAGQMKLLYDRVLPLDWHLKSGEQEVWENFENVSSGELWETHQSLKNNLILYARQHLEQESKRRNDPDEITAAFKNALDPRVLTIGFARRFAPYKRADLVLFDPDTLAKLVNDPDRPIQIVFGGKSHPADEPGKKILQRIMKLSQQKPFLGKVVFLENYDINLARHLVQGVDVWLNNPRRPLEASGTSGQKVVLNGILNLSILDGWWAEAFDGTNGFAIGSGRTHANQEVQDKRDSEALFKTLTTEVIPMFYDRDHDDLPQTWIARMKRGIRTLGWRFSADRMVMDYTKNSYIPAAGGVSCQMKLH